MEVIKSKRVPDYLAIIFIVGYFFAGIFISRDYGLNWDDLMSRDNGVDNVLYLSRMDKDALINSTEKYHGPAFEILLVLVEKGLHMRDFHAIFLMRHYVVSLFFITVLIAFFLFCRGLFHSSWLGLLGLSMLLFTPRLFGESFYNSKDIAFLGGMVWALYSLWLFSKSPTIPLAIFHGFTCAFAMDVRVIGLLYFPITILIFGYYVITRKLYIKDIGTAITAYAITFMCFMILLWPILMNGPIVHLAGAFNEMSNFLKWPGYNLYLGQTYLSYSTPWHYHWLWILITTPEVYVLGFTMGTGIFLTKILTRKLLDQTLSIFLLTSLFFFFFPLLYRSYKHAVVYDGWRHVYFVYPYFLVLVVYAASEILSIKQKAVHIVGLSILFLGICDSAFSIISMHPFQYVYFNRSANAIFKPIDKNFDIDYWGVSYKKGLEYLMERTPDKKPVMVAFHNYPGIINCKYGGKEMGRFHITTSLDSADYYLTNYRCHLTKLDIDAPLTFKNIIKLEVQGNPVMGIYQLK